MEMQSDGPGTMTGEQLRALRNGKGWTMKRLAEEIGLSKAFIGMMERGEKPIEKRTAIAARCLLEHQHP